MDWKNVKRGIIFLLGIAGSGKTYTAVNHYNSLGYKVLVLTATNNTARALSESLGVDVKTICSGAFISKPPVQYYCDFKDLSDYDVVILDEALLAGTKRVFDLAMHLKDTHIVVICTDERQMLPDLNNEGVLSAFEECKKHAECVEEFTTIYRTDDPETQENYRYWYNRAGQNNKLYTADDLRSMFKTVCLEDLEYNDKIMFVCVSNNDVQYVADLYQLSSKDVETTPGGACASQVNSNRRLPKLTRNEVDMLGAKEWNDYANDITICRGQGRTANGLVVNVMSESELQSDKGIYTAYTRSKHDDNFFVSIIPDYKPFKLSTIDNKPVKNLVDYQINKSKGDIMKMGDEMPNFIFNNIHGIYNNDTDETFYNKKHLFTKDKKHISVVNENCFVLDRKKYTRMSDGTILTQQLNPKKSKWSREYANGQLNINPYNLVKKMTPINYMDEVYSICAEHGTATLNFFDLSMPRHKERRFEFDMRKAYPHAFYLSPIPASGILSHEYDANKLNWYFVKKQGAKRVDLATEHYAKLLEKYNMFEIEFAFATPYSNGCLIGDIFKEMLQTVEGTDEIYSACRIVKSNDEFDEDGNPIEKEQHYYEWGWFLKKYIEKAGNVYVRDNEHCWELMLIAVKSEMAYQTLKASMAIKGVDPKEGLNVDAFYFENLTYETIEKIDNALDEGWEYRINSTLPMPVIMKNGDCKYKDGRYCVHKNFTLETKAERKKRLDAEKAKERRAKKKAEKMLDNEQ